MKGSYPARSEHDARSGRGNELAAGPVKPQWSTGAGRRHFWSLDMLRLEPLEDRDTPAVTVLVAVLDPAPGQPPVAKYFLAIAGDPPHSPGRVVDPQGGRWEAIWVGA